MSRILHVANFAHISLGLWCYNSDRRIRNGFTRNNHLVWDFSDRDVSRASNIFGSRKMGIGGANKKFLQTVENFKPDCIVLGHADIIRSKTLQEVKRRHKDIRIAVYNFDPLSNPNNVAAIADRIDVADAIFVTTGIRDLRQFKTKTNIVSYMPNPADRAVDSGTAFSQSGQANDIFMCIGAPTSDQDPRLLSVQYLLRHYPELKMAYYGMLGKPNLLGAQYLETIQNTVRMGLNISRENDVPLYSSDRIAHIFGNGLLALMPNGTGFERFFDASQAVFFKDFDDLGKKAMQIKNDDAMRRTIAEAGWKRYYDLFRSELVTQYIFEVTMGLPHSHNYAWQDQIIK